MRRLRSVGLVAVRPLLLAPSTFPFLTNLLHADRDALYSTHISVSYRDALDAELTKAGITVDDSLPLSTTQKNTTDSHKAEMSELES